MRLITDVLRDHDKGNFIQEVSEQFQELVLAAQEARKPGKLTLTLTVRPNKGATDGCILAVAVKVTEPPQDQPESFFFADDHGGLHREDPRQKVLFTAAPKGVPSGVAKVDGVVRAPVEEVVRFNPDTGEVLEDQAAAS